MRITPFAIAFAVLSAPQQPNRDLLLLTDGRDASATEACIATAPMPVVPLTTDAVMPIVKVDSSKLAPMPVKRLRACYLQ